MSELLRLATQEARPALEAARAIGADAVQISERLLPSSWLASQAADQAAAINIVDRLHIAEPNLLPNSGLILPFKSTVKNLLERNSYSGPFYTFDEYEQRCLHLVPTPVRVSKVPGTNISITTPEWFAAAIESGNPTWLGQPTPGLLGPRDIPALLNEMPNKTYFKRIFISDKPDPFQDWNSQYTGTWPFLSEMSMDRGEFRTFGTRHNPLLRSDVLHEWSHELRFRFWRDPTVTDRFFDANFFEQQEWAPSAYSRVTPDEMWAVLGERYLGTNTNDFLEATERGPIRSVVWMHALDKSLQEVPLALRSQHHQAYLDRVDHVNRFVVGPALDKVHRYNNVAWYDHVRSNNLMNFLEQKQV